MVLSLVLVIVGFAVSMLYGLFFLDFSVDSTGMDNTSAIESTTDIFSDAADSILSSDILGYIAYFLPVSGFYVLTEVFFTCIVVYMVATSIYQLIEDWVINRSS